MYKCGLLGGERLRLIKPLVIRNADGSTGATIPIGSLWHVIGGDTQGSEVVWLRDPDGDRHTWDHESIFEWFEVVS